MKRTVRKGVAGIQSIPILCCFQVELTQPMKLLQVSSVLLQPISFVPTCINMSHTTVHKATGSHDLPNNEAQSYELHAFELI